MRFCFFQPPASAGTRLTSAGRAAPTSDQHLAAVGVRFARSEEARSEPWRLDGRRVSRLAHGLAATLAASNTRSSVAAVS